MKNFQSSKKEYKIINDPHMYYFIQSPKKIIQLLKTGLYRLSDCKLIDVETSNFAIIDQNVLKPIKQECLELEKKKQAKNTFLNETKFRQFQRQKLMTCKMRSKITNRCSKTLPENNTTMNSKWKNIRGFKQFMHHRIL